MHVAGALLSLEAARRRCHGRRAAAHCPLRSEHALHRLSLRSLALLLLLPSIHTVSFDLKLISSDS